MVFGMRGNLSLFYFNLDWARCIIYVVTLGLRRRNSAFRRKTNMYVKTQEHLQRALNVQWIIHNFVRIHFTTQVVPTVKLGTSAPVSDRLEFYSMG
jgi:hypothetical protein